MTGGLPGSAGEQRRQTLRVLITGTEGYIGCLLAPMLVERGYEVTGLDTGYFTEARLGGDPEQGFPTIRKDLRHLSTGDLEGFDAAGVAGVAK